MYISYFGHSSFRIKSKTAVVVTDPFDKSIGWHFAKTAADIVTLSHNHNDHQNRDGIKNEDAFFIDGPGEYEIKEVMIKALKTYHDDKNGEERGDNVVYLFEMEDVHICHLGDIGHELSDSQIKELEATDVLMIPVGGVYTIDPKQAVKIIKKIEPSIVIPMHYKAEGLSREFDEMFTLDQFLEEIEIEPKKTDKLSVTVGTLPEEMEVVVLER